VPVPWKDEINRLNSRFRHYDQSCKKVFDRGKDRAGKMQLALGSEGKGSQEIPRTHRFDGGRSGRNVALERVYSVLGSGDGESREVVGAVSLGDSI
jgi:hypothetical protein